MEGLSLNNIRNLLRLCTKLELIASDPDTYVSSRDTVLQGVKSMSSVLLECEKVVNWRSVPNWRSRSLACPEDPAAMAEKLAALRGNSMDLTRMGRFTKGKDSVKSITEFIVGDTQLASKPSKELRGVMDRVSCTSDLVSVLQNICSSTTVSEIVAKVQQGAQEVISCSASLFFQDGLIMPSEELAFLAHVGTEEMLVCKPSHGLVGMCYKHRRPMNIRNVKGHRLYDAAVDKVPGSEEEVMHALLLPIADDQGEVVAVLHLKRVDDRAFSPSEEFLASVLASETVATVRTVRNFLRLRDSQRHTEAIVTASRSLVSDLSFDCTVKRILETAKELVQADRSTLYMVDGGELKAFICDGLQEFRLPVDSGVAGVAFRSRNLQNTRFARDSPHFNHGIDAESGYFTESMLTVPVFGMADKSGEVIALIQMINKTAAPKYFTEVDEAALQSLSTMTSIAINNSQLFEAAQQSAERATCFLEMFKTLAATLEIKKLLCTITRQARELLDADRGTVFIVDRQRKQLWATVAEGIDEGTGELRFPMDVGIAGYVATSGSVVNIANAYDDPRFNSEVDRLTGYTTKSMLCMPIYNSSNEIIGVTQMINKRSGHHFNHSDEEVLRAFTTDASISLQNSQRFEEAKRSQKTARVLLDVSQVLSSNLETKAKIAGIVMRAKEVAQAESCSVFVLDRGARLIKLSEHEEDVEAPMTTGIAECLRCKAIVSQQTSTGTSVFAPLSLHNETIGCIQLHKAGQVSESDRRLMREVQETARTVLSAHQAAINTKSFEETDEEILAALSCQASIAIENSQLFEKTAKMHAYLNTVLSSIDNVVFTVDEGGFLVRFNHALEPIFGLSEEFMRSVPCDQWAENSHPDNQRFFEDFLTTHRSLEAVRNSGMDLRHTPTSEPVYMQYSILPIMMSTGSEDEGKVPSGTVVVMENLTPKRKLLQALTLLERGVLSLVRSEFVPESQVNLTLGEIIRLFHCESAVVYLGSDVADAPTYAHPPEAKAMERPKRSLQMGSGSSGPELVYQEEADRSFATVPLIVGEQLVGSLLLCFTGHTELSSNDHRVLRILGELITTFLAIDNKMSLEVERAALLRNTKELREANEHLKVLKDLAQKSEQAKSTFLMNMSHEIRTPLNAIIGFTELLLADDLGEDHRKLVQTIYNSGEALLAIIKDILDISKIEADEMDVIEIEFDVRDTVSDAVDILAEKASRRAICLDVFVAPDVPERVLGDPYRFRQLLINFLSNAVKFSYEDSTVRLAVTADVRQVASDAVVPANALVECCLRVEVEDSGIGISEEGMARLFQPFSQLDSSTTKRYEGSGLGLAICKKLALLMNGDVGLRSEVGKGSTFWFTLGLRCQETPVNTLAVKAMPLQGVKVAVCLAHPAYKDTILRYLNAWQMAVTVVDGKPSAVACHGAAVVLVDAEHFIGSSEPLTKLLAPAKSIGIAPFQALAAARPGGGVHFSVTSPVRYVALLDAMLDAVGAHQIPKSPSLLRRRALPSAAPQCSHILLAEDNALNSALIRRQLLAFGYGATVVANGKLAVEEVRKRQFDLVLMDCHMPEMDGYEATALIRQLEEELGRPSVPIVALTADAMEGTRAVCLDCGMSDYFAKPLRKADVLAIATKYLHGDVS